MRNGSPPRLYLLVEPAVIPPCFTPLLARGVRIAACLECSLKELMCRQLGLAEDYLENRVQTVFLNGHPVDDVSRATIAEGATVALSAAMPGLAGAVLRKGGALAALRKDITYQSEDADHVACEGSVIVKLFNMTTREVGPLLLARGIWIRGVELAEVFARCLDFLRQGCRQARLDGSPNGLDQLSSRVKDKETIFLQVNTQ